MSKIKVELQETMGSDLAIANAAWTSSTTFEGKKKKTDEDVAKLVKMLADQKHGTPFESVIFRFWIKLPIQTDRQLMTHRIASHNGMSGRYRTMPSEFLAVPKDVEKTLINAFCEENEVHKEIRRFIESYNQLCEDANNWYLEALEFFKETEENELISNKEYKRLREFFRGVLPQNNMTERVTIMNLRSFSNFQLLRNSEHAQPEIRLIAQLMLEEVKKSNICPVALESLEKNGWKI